MTTKIFLDGIMVEQPNEKAPAFVKAKISINLDKFYDAAQPHVSPRGWISIDILESKKGGYYASVNEWKPLEKPEGIPTKPVEPVVEYPEDEINPDDIPF